MNFGGVKHLQAPPNCAYEFLPSHIFIAFVHYRNLCSTPFFSPDTLSKSIYARLFLRSPLRHFLSPRLQPLGQVFRTYFVHRATVGSLPCFVKRRDGRVFSLVSPSHNMRLMLVLTLLLRSCARLPPFNCLK